MRMNACALEAKAGTIAPLSLLTDWTCRDQAMRMQIRLAAQPERIYTCHDFAATRAHTCSTESTVAFRVCPRVEQIVM